MRQFLLYGITILLALIATIIFHLNNQPAEKESIKYFPINKETQFESAFTNVCLLSLNKNKPYSLLWRVDSTIDKKAYLRQDIGLLFVNGRLIGKLSEWKQNGANISLQKKLAYENSAKIEALSFHHAEIHEKGQSITSKQMMSLDHLYIMGGRTEAMQSFRKATTIAEKNWQKKWDQQLQQQAERLLNRSARKFAIDVEKYDVLSLIELAAYINEPLPHFTMEHSEKVIGQLWEGLYKNYFLGIKKEDGTVADVLNSTIPLLLFAKDQSELLVIFADVNEDLFLLRQSL